VFARKDHTRRLGIQIHHSKDLRAENGKTILHHHLQNSPTSLPTTDKYRFQIDSLPVYPELSALNGRIKKTGR
jgi:hypothetical protein